MSAGAIVMLTLAMVVTWGGLGLAIVLLSRHPEQPTEPLEPPPPPMA